MDILGNIGRLILAYPLYAAIVVASGIGGVTYYFYKATIDFWRMDAGYCIPFIGRLARLARRVAPAADRDFKGWLQSEVTLGSDYANHIHSLSLETFTLYRTYLGRADGGRTPLPGWLMAVLIVLVAAEAYGISYLIAGGLAHNMSQNARLIGTVALVIVVCVVLVFLTHAAGRNLYRSLLVDRNIKKWDEAVNAISEPTESSGSIRSALQRPLETHPGILVANTHLDDDDPDYSQCLNRVGNKKTWFIVWSTLAIILMFGGFQVGLRVNDTLQKLTRDTIGISNADGTASNSSSNPIPDFGTGQTDITPTVLSGPDKAADSRAANELMSTEAAGGWLTSLTLAFIYLMTQITSIYAGYGYGFAGEYSEESYRETRGCQVYETYQQQEKRLKGIANRRMQSLHQRISDRTRNRNIAFGGDFYSFLQVHTMRTNRPQPTATIAIATTTTTATATIAAAPQKRDPTVGFENSPASKEDQLIKEHLAKMEVMSTDEMRAYLMALPADQYDKMKSPVRVLMAAKSNVNRVSEIDEMLGLVARPVAGEPREVGVTGTVSNPATA